MSYEQPYKGIKVVDLSQGIAGPYCAMLLAQYGADVIKIEPFEGDWARILGTTYGDHSAFSIAGNLGKRSVALDLKKETATITLSGPDDVWFGVGFKASQMKDKPCNEARP